MIQIVEGKIGSGKTYYAVRHLLKRYYEYDSASMSWFPCRPHILVSNISNLKLDHISLDEVIQQKGLKGVFSEKYALELRSGRSLPVVFVIDEAQAPGLFHRKFYDPDVFLFFQKSRHYGIDIYLITQDVESISKEIRVLPEHIIHAVARSLTSGLNFHYKQMSGGDVENNLIVKKDSRIFRAYSSFKFEEGEKPKSILLKYAVYVCILVSVAFVSYKTFIGSFFKRGDSVKKESVSLASKTSLPSGDKEKPHIVEYKNLISKKDDVVLKSTDHEKPVPVNIPEIKVADIRKCPRIGQVEHERILTLYQCGETVFTVSDKAIVKSRQIVASPSSTLAQKQQINMGVNSGF